MLSCWKTLVYVVVLANLPDLDVLAGLIAHGNGNVFHRGPSHSFLFALSMGLLACRASRWWSAMPRVNPIWCFLVILSHVLADAIFTDTPVSLWWPLEAYQITGYCGWNDVFYSIVRGFYLDVAVVSGFGTLLLVNRLSRYRGLPFLFARAVKATVSSVTNSRKVSRH
jgi:membrane-bound metal-dependent hydrolase YbcI (DUF457 family)